VFKNIEYEENQVLALNKTVNVNICKYHFLMLENMYITFH